MYVEILYMIKVAFSTSGGKADLFSMWWDKDLSMKNHIDIQIKYKKMCSTLAGRRELSKGQGESENSKEEKQ